MPPARTLFLNLGHLLDHLFMLIFAKAAFEGWAGFRLRERSRLRRNDPLRHASGGAIWRGRTACRPPRRSLLAMLFIFGQVPISDVILSRCVPDRLRPKILSFKFLLNLSVGAMTLPLVAWMLKNGGGFESMLELLALASICVTLAALVLPTQSARLRGSE